MSGTATVELTPPILYELIMRRDLKILRASEPNRKTGFQVCLIETNLLTPGYHGKITISVIDGTINIGEPEDL
jgi:hypothetical protein